MWAISACFRHVLDARQFERHWLDHVLFPAALELEQTSLDRLEKTLLGKRLFYLFYEPSTRTRVSFEMAATLLGASVHGIDSHEQYAQEEHLEDRIRVLNGYPHDFLLIRYDQEGGASRAAAVSAVPVINAGDGPGQHPTQALLDAYTLWREFGRIDGLRIALVGDLSYQRSTNSLAYLLTQYRDLRLYLVSPQLLRIRDEVREHLVRSEVLIEEVRDVRAVASEVDVIYLTRAQTSRLEHARRFEGEAGNYSVDAEVLRALPSSARVLHRYRAALSSPPEVDADSRIACFRQAALDCSCGWLRFSCSRRRLLRESPQRVDDVELLGQRPAWQRAGRTLPCGSERSPPATIAASRPRLTARLHGVTNSGYHVTESRGQSVS